MFRSHGISREKFVLINKRKPGWFYEMQLLGFNYRITDIQCALGLSQLDKSDYFIKRRREIVENYKREFSNMREIVCLKERDYAVSSWHIFPIRVNKDRDIIFNELTSKGIGVNVHYIPIYLHPYYKKLGYRKGLCPVAEKYYREAITLPVYPEMSDNEVKRVIRTVKATINRL
jgi:dTDP-4-amino-4,6-dideoxygalactose transaminase